MEQLPDKMTGQDLIAQENHEFAFERQYFDSLDRVERRDKRGEITSMVPSDKYRKGYDLIEWKKDLNQRKL